MIDWGGAGAVAAMYAAFLVVGWFASARARAGTASELLVAGRSMPLWIAVMTMTATWVDGGYLLGTAEYAYKHGVAYGLQGGVCFGISLILGGLLFAKQMRRMEYSTMVDPFAARYGPRWAAVLAIPALLGELLWSGALLVAIGATFGELLHLDLTAAIVLSAVVVTAYTMVGGMWSVAYTDIFQLALIPLGMLAALPFALEQAGGLMECVRSYAEQKQGAARLLPPWTPDEYWTTPNIVAWWDTSVMLMFGGIPWNCYFQRVLSCETPERARTHSLLAGVATCGLTIPPLLLGMAAFVAHGADAIQPSSLTLPRILGQSVPYPVMLLGLAAIIGAVTSSFSASILSGGAMLSWNIYRPLWNRQASVAQMSRVIRGSIVVLGITAVLLALGVKSVAALWLFTGDLVFVLLLPQLVMALYDPRANLAGSVCGFVCALCLRLSGGMSIETDNGLLGFAAWIPYPELFSAWLPGSPQDWYDPLGATKFPIRTLAAVTGLIVTPVVSRIVLRGRRKTERETETEP